MTHKQKLEIIGIAKSLRKEMESKYGDLAGLCLEASQILISRLQSAKYKPRLIEGCIKLNPKNGEVSGYGYHFWVEINQNYLDITGDQFNKLLHLRLPKIMLRPKSRCPQYISEKII